jgi:hypothetical protein
MELQPGEASHDQREDGRSARTKSHSDARALGATSKRPLEFLLRESG